MGLLDDAIREHLELKRRRGADAHEIGRLESEALGPVRRSADGVPDLSDTVAAPKPEASPPAPWADEKTSVHAPERPDAAGGTSAPGPGAAGGTSAPGAYEPPPAPQYEPPAAAADPWRPDPPGLGHAPPTAAHPAPEPRSYEPPSTAAHPTPAPYGHPPVDPPPTREPWMTDPYPAREPEPEPEPEPDAEPQTGSHSLFSRLPFGRRKGKQAVGDPEAASHTEPDPYADPEPSPFDPPAPPATPAPAAFEAPPQSYAHEPDIVPADDEPDGEELLEETPDFLEETPDHDRLWFEQRPPRDFDFDG